MVGNLCYYSLPHSGTIEIVENGGGDNAEHDADDFG